MKSEVYFRIALASALVLLLRPTNAAIDLQVITNSHGVTEFIVLNGHSIGVPNQHRPDEPTLKLSLHGATIEQVEHPSEGTWNLLLNDSTKVLFSSIPIVNSNVTEYYFLWHGGGPNVNREVCFHYGHNGEFWYNAYQSDNSRWPMETNKTVPKGQFNRMFEFGRYDSASSAREFTFVLEQLFLNSDGFAILLDQYQPLFIRRDPNGDGDPLICASVDNVAPYMADNHDPTYKDIKVHIFAAANVKAAADYVVHKSVYIPKPKAIPDERHFQQPSWLTYEIYSWQHFTQELILSYTNDIVNLHGFSSKSEIMITHYGWEANASYTWDSTVFSNVDSMITTLHERGNRIGTIIADPHMTTNIETKKYFISDTNLIDFSAPDASKYYASVLTRFRFEKQIDSFLLAAFTLTSAQLKFNSTQYREYPSMYATNYVETAIQTGNVLQTEFAFKTQHLPAFLRLISFEHTPVDQLLRELIPTVLSVSIAGYSFVVPYSIGGFNKAVKPTEEIIIRWIQATALMPSMSFAKLPWNYTEQTVTIAKKFVALHTEHAPTIIELAKRRVQNGAPIVRPMWYGEPEDVATYRIGDQFMLGDDIVVAPVIAEAQRERTVYLPTGTWIDQHGKEWVGPREYKIAVPLDELPYFKRKH